VAAKETRRPESTSPIRLGFGEARSSAHPPQNINEGTPNHKPPLKRRATWEGMRAGASGKRSVNMSGEDRQGITERKAGTGLAAWTGTVQKNDSTAGID
jgi:hypothetical protein